jgi:fucose 4-O-acetylase-like acetyltransferase
MDGDSPAFDGAAALLPKRRARRIVWIDGARGLAILLVVYGHVLWGLNVQLDPVQFPLQSALFNLIYTIHMPAFFFIGGMLIFRHPAPAFTLFLRRKASQLLYPYLLWSLIQGTIQISLGRFVNNPVQWQDLAQILWRPMAQFWFLYGFFFLSLLLFGLRRWTRPALIASGVGCFALAWVCGVSRVGNGASFLYYAVWFFAGHLVGRAGIPTKLSAEAARLLAIAGAAGVAAGFVLARAGLGYADLRFLPVSACGIMLVVGLACICPPGVARRALAGLGQESLVIYLLHILSASGARILLHRVFRVDDFGLVLALSVAAGVILPLAARRLLALMGVDRQLGLVSA